MAAMPLIAAWQFPVTSSIVPMRSTRKGDNMRTRLLWLMAMFLAIGMMHGGTALATDAHGFSGSTVVTGRFDEIDAKAHTIPADFWQLRLKTRGQSDLFVQSNTWEPGGSTGWHTHPGPSLIVITAGLVTAYEGDDEDCEPHVYGIGTVMGNTLIDPGGEHVHILRNETSSTARGYAVQIIPPLGPSGRRINAPHPLNCPLTID